MLSLYIIIIFSYEVIIINNQEPENTCLQFVALEVVLLYFRHISVAISTLRFYEINM